MVIANTLGRIVKETAPIIVFYSILQLFTGGILENMSNFILLFPGLLILVPSMLNMRGNISSTFGARISSSLHLGYIKPGKFSKTLKVNILSALILSVILSVSIAFFASLTCIFIGQVCISFWTFLIITVTAGFVSSVILTFSTVAIATFAYKKGLDPDNITMPSIASFGDIVTILSLYGVVYLMVII